MPNLKVRFMDMGLGDCIVVQLPGGEVLMVDCGSRRALPDPGGLWRNMRDLVGSRINALVLTHPDRDHYNHLHRVVPDTVAIDAVYHSARRREYWGLGALAESHAWGLDLSRVHAVTLNSMGCRLGTAAVGTTPDGQPVGLGQRDHRGFLKILQSSTDPACNVWILASNVASQSPTDSERRNAGSIVTLIEYGATKVLLTGDARIETEDFLAYASESLANLTLVQMPHHGSVRRTFSEAFIQHLNAHIAIASTFAQNGDALPDKELLEVYAWHARTLPGGASNSLRCWDVVGEVSPRKRQRASSAAARQVEVIIDIVPFITTKQVWSTEGHSVEFEFDRNGAEVS